MIVIYYEFTLLVRIVNMDVSKHRLSKTPFQDSLRTFRDRQHSMKRNNRAAYNRNKPYKCHLKRF